MVFPLLGAIGGALFGSAAATAATISVAGSLVGGAMARREERKAIARQNDYNDPVNIRVRAEEAGFNPITFIGPGVGNQTATGGTNYMGSAIADATATIAQTMMGQADEKKRLQDIEAQNQRLQKQIHQQTLRPAGGSIYDAMPARHGVLPGQRVTAGSAAAMTAADRAAKEAAEKAEAASDSGNAPGSVPGTFFGLPFHRTGAFSDGGWWTDAYGEPAEWAVAVPALGVDLGYNLGYLPGQRLGEAQNRAVARSMGTTPMTIGGKTYAQEPTAEMRAKRQSEIDAAVKARVKSQKEADRKRPLRHLGL